MSNSMGSLKKWNEIPVMNRAASAVRSAFTGTLAVSARIDRTNRNDPRGLGIDVSYWNGAIDWNAVKGYSPKILYTGIRGSVGLNYRDSKFESNMDGAKSAGILRMPYHYFYPNVSVDGQISLFLSVLAGTDPELGIVADIEDLKGLSYQTAAGPCESFCKGLRDRSGRKVIIYSRKYFADPLWNGAAWLKSFDWWIANYLSNGDEHAGPPLLPKGVDKYIFHQTSSTGAIPGIESLDVDHNRFNGSSDEFYRYAGIETKPPELTDSEKLSRLWTAHPELW